jgi:hypothetical protein
MIKIFRDRILAYPERNGLWLTLYSMVVWLGLFDIGFGNGMRNRLAEAKAAGDNELCRKYISSTYAWAPVQLNKIINNKASGIWNK